MIEWTRARIRSAAAAAGLALAAITVAGTPAEAQRAAGGPPDWPCVQRLVPELAWGTIWTGPSIDELEETWWSDPEISRIVRVAAARETSTDEAVKAIWSYLENVEGDREHKLTLLFAGIFEVISRERTQTIDAILRYSRGQVGRLERVGAIVDQLEQARRDPDTDPAMIERLENELHWERRVFEDRQGSLRTLCLQPYLLEERLSRIVRAIQAEL